MYNYRPTDREIPLKKCAAYGDVPNRQQIEIAQDDGIYDYAQLT